MDLQKDKKLYNIGVISLGCDKNRIDTEKMLYRVRHYGHRIVNSLSQADVVVVNTCAFIGDAREESVNAVLEAADGGRKVIVTGCMPQKFIDEIVNSFTEADAFLGTRDYALINYAIEKVMQGERFNGVGLASLNKQTDSTDNQAANTLAKSGASSGSNAAGKPLGVEAASLTGVSNAAAEDLDGGRVLSTAGHYAYLMVSDGCDNNCSYCLIPKIRGKYRSFRAEDILKEAAELLRLGVREIVLVAQDLTMYGTELTPKDSLAGLIKKLSALPGLQDNSLRLMYCYPERVTDQLIDEIARNPKVIKYIDMPIQHISDAVLRRMRRASTSHGIKTLIQKLRQKVPGISIRSTFIVGFPGETQQDFYQLLQFLQETQLDNAGFFKFSRERETEAYNLTPRVHKTAMQKRYNTAEQVQAEVHLAHNTALLGRTVRVICDGSTQNRLYSGRTHGSAPQIDRTVVFDCPEGMRFLPGDFADVLITHADAVYAKGSAQKKHTGKEF